MIEKLILGRKPLNYFTKILRQLIRILHENRPLSVAKKEDLRFLVNATILELYYSGYSINYIKKIPDIVLFPNSYKEDFPFDKEYGDFNNVQRYNEFRNQALGHLTLKKQLASLLNLVKRPKRKGYFVLRIDNFDFQEQKPLNIWDVVFYNPQLSLKVKYGDKKELNEYVECIERYFEQYVEGENKEKLKSNCNAVVATEYRPQYFNYVDPSIFKAIEKVNYSLSVLKNLKHLHVGGHSFSTAVNLKTVIVTDKNLSYRGAPWIIHDYDDDKAFSIDTRAETSVANHLKWAHKLDPGHEFHKKIIDIYVAVNRYRQNPFAFSFRDFWITVCDPLFPNKPDDFIKFCYKCVELYLLDQHLTNVKIFLRDAVRQDPFSRDSYTLRKSKMKSFGLEVFLYKPVKARTFSKQYMNISKDLKFDFLTDIIDELDRFVNNTNVYLEQVKARLTTILYEVYAERNLEVHNNLSTDMSMVKLREFCISLAIILRLVISQKITSRTRTINDLKI
jgi:hypothetical protein